MSNLDRIFNTLNRLFSSEKNEEKWTPPTSEQLMQWSSSCMSEGLPDKFFVAWVEYSKDKQNNVNNISYRCIINEGEEPQLFSPPDDLYVVQCIEALDEFLDEEKKNWTRCKLEFDSEKTRLRYFY